MEQMVERLVAAIEKTDANQERMIAKLHAYQEEVDAWLEEMKDVQKQTTAYEEATEACLEKQEANPGELQFVVVHQEGDDRSSKGLASSCRAPPTSKETDPG
jgi:hypothetical protein